MANILGADSATPKPTKYRGHRIWGVYVAGDTFHVWTHAEVKQLDSFDVDGVLPIVVPPQKERWWMDNHGYAILEELVRDAIAWGIPEGSPLCLDIEESQAEAIPPTPDVSRAWAVACKAHKLIPWCYSPRTFLDPYNNRWLAEWPDVTPKNPQVPEGYRGWQYAGNVDGIDLDVFLANEIFLSPDLKPVRVNEIGWQLVTVEKARVVDAAHVLSTGSSDVGATDADTVSDKTQPPAPTSLFKEHHEVPVQSGPVGHLGGNVVGTDMEGTKMASNPVSPPSWTAIKTELAPIAAYVGVGTGLFTESGMNTWLRAAQVVVSGIVAAVEHWHNKAKQA